MTASFFSQRFLAALAAGVLLITSGCSTVSSRIEKNPEIFAALPPAQQNLVRQGRIDNKMPKEAVYLAWGRPSSERFESDSTGDYETWLYNGYRQEPVQTFGYTPRGCRYGGRYGGYPSIQTVYVSIPYLDRSATFKKDRVIGYQTIRGGY